MTRPIKFRAWDKKEKRWYSPTHKAYIGELFELFVGFAGDLVAHTMKGVEHESLWPERFILMQFTGLFDKNGKEMYEGDICKQVVHGHEVVAPMVWNRSRACFGLDAVVDFEAPAHVIVETSTHGMPEVIGNIYENPELIASS